jgi:hypothetical protein
MSAISERIAVSQAGKVRDAQKRRCCVCSITVGQIETMGNGECRWVPNANAAPVMGHRYICGRCEAVQP